MLYRAAYTAVYVCDFDSPITAPGY